MKRIIKLTESDLTRIVRRVIKEEEDSDKYDPIELLLASKDRKIYPEYVKTINDHSVLWAGDMSSASGFEPKWKVQYHCDGVMGVMGPQQMTLSVVSTDEYKARRIESFFRSATTAPTKVRTKNGNGDEPNLYIIVTKFENVETDDEDGGNIFYNMLVYAIETLK